MQALLIEAAQGWPTIREAKRHWPAAALRLGAGELARARLAREFVQMVRGLIPGETLALTVLRDETRVPVTLVVAAAPADRQVFIDAEELLGVLLDEKNPQPTVQELRPLE